MSTKIRPWLECVDLHPDVLSQDFSEDVFALDLGSLSDYVVGRDHGQPESALPRVPPVYRDAESFFCSSYLTTGLRSLLEDVLSRLDEVAGNRVIKLLTPFGGGKSHTLAALLHAARSRSALDLLPEAVGLPRPPPVRVAVIDGQFFDATTGKKTPDGQLTCRTIWGWIAWSLAGRDGFDLVRIQDETCVAPGGDAIVQLLQCGPNLILIDELLEYLISTGGIRIGKTTLRDETLSFMKRLTVAVANVASTMLVYSLQSSNRESLEYTSLLSTLEHLAARKDQRREPVAGNEILNVIQRRLLAATPDSTVANDAATAYSQAFSQMRRSYARDDTERREADDDGLALRNRIRASYPFHPALIDLMRERWAAIPEFQRTRGALRFLASCLRSAHRSGNSKPLLGPGDVPIEDQEVRLAFFKEVGQREDFLACLEHDFVGANARVNRIDKRNATEVTAESTRRSATRVATTILLHSFGGLQRGQAGHSDLLPPGIGEKDVMGICIGPDLDNTTTQARLKELKEHCLYLHFDGVRYCFKSDPNVTLLIEQEVEVISRDKNFIKSKIREMIDQRLSGHNSAIVWPSTSSDIPDRELRFLVGYLPLEFALRSDDDQQRMALEMLQYCGNRPREFRNGLGLAVPNGGSIETLRRATCYLLAIERVQIRWREHNLNTAQKSQAKERYATESAAAESALLKLYSEVWIPALESGNIMIESVKMGGRPLQSTLDDRGCAQIHRRILELLTVVHRKVFESIAPGKISELFEFDGVVSKTRGIATIKVAAGFFTFIGFPRLIDGGAVHKAILRCIETGLFGYVTGRPVVGEDGRYQVVQSRVIFQRSVLSDEIDIDSGFLIAPMALPAQIGELGSTTRSGESSETTGGGGGTSQFGKSRGTEKEGEASQSAPREVVLSFKGDRHTVFSAWSAIANLADLADGVSITARATLSCNVDESRFENGVLDPLRELDLIDD